MRQQRGEDGTARHTGATVRHRRNNRDLPQAPFQRSDIGTQKPKGDRAGERHDDPGPPFAELRDGGLYTRAVALNDSGQQGYCETRHERQPRYDESSKDQFGKRRKGRAAIFSPLDEALGDHDRAHDGEPNGDRKGDCDHQDFAAVDGLGSRHRHDQNAHQDDRNDRHCPFIEPETGHRVGSVKPHVRQPLASAQRGSVAVEDVPCDQGANQIGLIGDGPAESILGHLGRRLRGEIGKSSLNQFFKAFLGSSGHRLAQLHDRGISRSRVRACRERQLSPTVLRSDEQVVQSDRSRESRFERRVPREFESFGADIFGDELRDLISKLLTPGHEGGLRQFDGDAVSFAGYRRQAHAERSSSFVNSIDRWKL